MAVVEEKRFYENPRFWFKFGFVVLGLIGLANVVGGIATAGYPI